MVVDRYLIPIVYDVYIRCTCTDTSLLRGLWCIYIHTTLVPGTRYYRCSKGVIQPSMKMVFNPLDEVGTPSPTLHHEGNNVYSHVRRMHERKESFCHTTLVPGTNTNLRSGQFIIPVDNGANTIAEHKETASTFRYTCVHLSLVSRPATKYNGRRRLFERGKCVHSCYGSVVWLSHFYCRLHGSENMAVW